MTRLAAILLALFLLIPPLVVSAQNAPGADPPIIETERYPVVFEIDTDETPRSHARATLALLGIDYSEYYDRLRYTYEHAIIGYALLLTPFEIEKAQRLFGDENEFGVKNIVTSGTFSIPTVPDAFSTVTGRASDALRGTQVIPAGVLRTGAPLDDSSNVDVAVIDTGVDATNPDLNVVGGYDCVDPENDFGVDGHGHGTHVAGTIGALDDGRGVVGVAPGANIYSVRVLDSSGSGSLASVICGIDWVAAHGDVIDVANMSLGGSGYDSACGEGDAFHNAICVATEQTVFVVAAGNSTAPTSEFSPANFDEVVTVSAYTDFDGLPGGFALAPSSGCTAMSVDDELAAFSNYGEDVDVAAPGVCVLSTYLNGEFAYASGTSMASPHAAGCIAVFINDNPDQRDRAVEQVLAWSRSRSEFEIAGDHDSESEPLLNCGGVQRFEGE